MKEELTCELNGTKYLLVYYLVDNQYGVNQAYKLIRKYDCILRGAVRYDYKPRFFSSDKRATIQILVPENNIKDFNAERLQS